MRRTVPPANVDDIGVLGENIAPFLYRLKEEKEHQKHFQAVVRTLRTLIPSVEGVSVDLDTRRGTLDIVVRQNGVDYSSRIISEGTLRVLALCTIVVNPWGGSLVAFEEPENGVHPRRLELIADLLSSLVLDQGRQLIVTTHSALFCGAMLKKAREKPQDIGLFRVSQGPNIRFDRHLNNRIIGVWTPSSRGSAAVGRRATVTARHCSSDTFRPWPVAGRRSDTARR